jgi:hypothetical protein
MNIRRIISVQVSYSLANRSLAVDMSFVSLIAVVRACAKAGGGE